MQLTWHQILSYFTQLKRAESACFDTHLENNTEAVSVKLFSCNANHWYKALLCQVLTGITLERDSDHFLVFHTSGEHLDVNTTLTLLQVVF